MKISRILLAGTAAMLLAVLGCGAQGGTPQQSQANNPNFDSPGSAGSTDSAGSPSPPAEASKFTQLQAAADWQSCNSATGAGGSGAGTDWMAQNQNSPSMSGSSMEVSHSGNYGSGFWDLWDGYNRHWHRTGVACPKFQPGAWHHIQFFAKRAPDTPSYTLVSITVDGSTYPLNVTYSAKDVGWDGHVGVQFQLDVNATGQGVSRMGGQRNFYGLVNAAFLNCRRL